MSNTETRPHPEAYLFLWILVCFVGLLLTGAVISLLLL